MIRRRFVATMRLVWPLVFIAPLWSIIANLCWMSPAHAAISGILLLHERLPALLLAAAVLSVGVVLRKVARVRAALKTLGTLSGETPDGLDRILDAERKRFGVAKPKLTFLDVSTPICYTIAPGPTILVSRGFARDLSDADLAAVIRHELVHVARRDPQVGLLWHLAFAALLVPGFGDLERWMYDRRERRADAIAGTPRDGRYDALSERVRMAEAGLERSLGHAYAGAFDRGPAGGAVWLKPALAFSLVGALLASHAIFLRALPALAHHHC